jgi:galactonate dehydratase
VLSSAVAGLDQALWDIAGKVWQAPVHQLLGGPVRDRVRMYSWVGGDEPAEVADAVAEQVAAGFTAVKMNACGRMSPLAPAADLRRVVDRLAAARSVLGPERDVAIDCHGRLTPADARRLLPAVADLHPLFVEEPVAPGPARPLGPLVACSAVPIALGERLYSRGEFLAPLQDGVAVVQPDLSHAGGISEVRRIASLAEVFGALLAPHCPLGPIALAASLQVAFATPELPDPGAERRHPLRRGNDLLDYVMDRSPFTFVAGTPSRPRCPVSASRSTSRPYDRGPRAGTPGATLCGATSTGPSPSGERVPAGSLHVEVDVERGGRWTSLRAEGRQWLWQRPAPERAGVRPGDAFVDAGGLEECCRPCAAPRTTVTSGAAPGRTTAGATPSGHRTSSCDAGWSQGGTASSSTTS